MEKTLAEIQKAKAEAAKLRRDDEWKVRLLSYLAPFLTAAAAAIGVWVSVRKAGRDRRDAIEREVRDRREARRSAEIERFDERFAKAVEGLSSAKAGEESGAAVLVASMVRDKSEALSNQALQLLLVSLQTPHDEACERLLRYALERFARSAPGRLVAASDGEPAFGLVHIRTSHLNLAYLDLPELDLAFACLPNADFRGANLRESRAYRTELEDANLNGANLTEAQWAGVQAPGARFQKADLRKARLSKTKLDRVNFYKADLRDANFRQASLQGAQFNRAQVASADFHGAGFDDKALESMLEADDWQSAQLSNHDRTRLDALG